MEKIEIFKTLQQHRRLAEKRSPLYPQTMAAKFFIGVVSLLVIAYLAFIAVMLSLIANESRGFTALELIMGVMPIILAIDFGFRWIGQQTPSQIIKPYVLLPLPRYVCIDAFLFRSIFSWGNITWYAILIPFCLMSVVFAHGIGACLLLFLTYTIFVFANSQWYSIVRTLVVSNMLWWLLPIAVYALVFQPLYIGGMPTEKSFEAFFNLYATLGTWLDKGNILPLVIALGLLAIMVVVNRKLQYDSVMSEIGRTGKTTKIKKVSEFKFLDRYKEIGEYLKLEIKSLMRNKNPRKSFISATWAVVVITLICSFSDVYDNMEMTDFWCLYNLVVYAAMMLIHVMSYEGNYIDALMVHKENIYSLLRAKYYFFSALTIIPIILLLPTVFTGKWSIWMILSYALFTIGCQYFCIMQMAVYNKSSLPLNTKFVSKNGMGNNYVQIMTTLGIFIVPMVFVSLLSAFCSTTTSNIVMATVGAAFFLTHRLWLRNIYNRMMKRRYENMEGFRK